MKFRKVKMKSTSERKQSDDGDEESDEPVANRHFHRWHRKYAVSSIATSLDKVNNDITDFGKIQAKEGDVPLEKKDRLSPKK